MTRRTIAKGLGLDARQEGRFWSKVNMLAPNGCWEWVGYRNFFGYGQFAMDRNTNVAPHRVSYANYVGSIPDGLLVRHKCDNPSCVNPEHLELGTHDDNMRDKVERGRCVNLSGERHPNSKASDLDRASAAAALRAGATQKEIAAKYGVSVRSVRNWKKEFPGEI